MLSRFSPFLIATGVILILVKIMLNLLIPIGVACLVLGAIGMILAEQEKPKKIKQ